MDGVDGLCFHGVCGLIDTVGRVAYDYTIHSGSISIYCDTLVYYNMFFLQYVASNCNCYSQH